MRRVSLALAALVVAGGVVAGAAPATAVPPARDGVYVVMLKDQPAAAVPHSTRLDRTAPSVRDYVGQLSARKAALLAKVPGAQRIADYSYAGAGFAAKMTQTQASTLAARPDVLFVAPDTERQGADYETPSYLGLTGRDGVWNRLGGTARAGDGVIIGDIDSGITPENPAFAALPPSPSDRAVARRWHGSCDPGKTGPAIVCNNKLIGAKVFGPGTVDAVPDEYFGSPRDYDGHGTHTASTAAGDYGVRMTVDGKDFGKFSGMAPAARVAMYKALWHKADNTTSGNTSDLVKAIDEAVADGVDVINYSITTSTGAVDDPVAYAFYNAAKAGVFVSAAASNNGAGPSTVQSNYPWVTTVAAGTDNVAHHTTLTLGNGATYVGVGLGSAVPSSPVALPAQVGLSGADPVKLAQCYSKEWDPSLPGGVLDPAKVKGKIVVCDRGANDRVDKSRAVAEAGGVGMVLVNPGPNTLNADLHAIPTVHLDPAAGTPVKAYVSATANPTAALSASRDDQVTAPLVASFSSRGPAQATGGDLLKPDLLAPGVDLLAAVAPVNHKGRQFDFESGTSMATPHVAGLAALLAGAHPDWSPMAIKSALMTTANPQGTDGKPIRTDSGAEATPFDRGAGQVTPGAALASGLVYDSTAEDWDAFLCGQGSVPPSGKCAASMPATDLNVPSFGVGSLAGSQTVTRTLTNLGRQAWAGRVSVQEPPGVTVRVQPSILVVPPGAKQKFTVTFTRTTASYGKFVFGSLAWRPWTPGPDVRSPIAVRPAQVSAPAEVRGTGTASTATVSVRPGYSGTLTTTVDGPAPATENSAPLKHATGATFPLTAPAANEHVAKFTVTTPPGTRYARFATFAADVLPETDVDLYVYRAGTDDLVAQSSLAGSNEWVGQDAPSGAYDVYVDLSAGGDQTVRVETWMLGASTGTLSVDPAKVSVTNGKPVDLTARWTGLDPGHRYLARLSYSDGSTVAPASTLLPITT
ncbi:S8 family serine peptidase [Amycolatopsis sp. WGS_07]|uniref:S8 family serine peptidase n=1 Tax=Amycolatopsis sp. WGS_07 TaxID=3076764 RepID=UPI0038736555